MASNIEIENSILKRSETGFILFKIPFNSIRKKQTTAVKLDNEKIRVYVKGAPEVIIGECAYQLNDSGELEYLDQTEKDRIINEVVKSFAD